MIVVDSSYFIGITILAWPSYDRASCVKNSLFGVGSITLWLYHSVVKVTDGTLSCLQLTVSLDWNSDIVLNHVQLNCMIHSYIPNSLQCISVLLLAKWDG